MIFNDEFELVQENDTTFKIVHIINKEDIFNYSYYPQYCLAVQKWIGYLEDEQIIEIYKHVAFFTQEKKQLIRASISDLTDTENSFHNTNEWVVKNLIPESVKWGYRYAFFVKPKEYFAQLALEDVVEDLSNIEGLHEVRTFETSDEAYSYAVNLLKDD